jgi:predicted nucleic-acid-binding Zn-ribbon protein
MRADPQVKCPKCGTVMELKGEVSVGGGMLQNIARIYQCPKCKNIEIQE